MQVSLFISITIALLAAAAGDTGPAAMPAAAPSGTLTLPCRQPQLATREQIGVVVCGEEGAIRMARSTNGGQLFGPLTTVATVPALALGNHRGPRVALSGNAIIVSAIVGQQQKAHGAHGGPPDGNLMAWRSTDGGVTWSSPATLNSEPTAAREGLHGMAASDAVVATAWLDLRSKGMKLYAAVSRDGGATWGGDRLVYDSPSGTICQCCHPSVVVRRDGTVLVMFRNSLDGNRDLYLARGRPDGSFEPAQKLGKDEWAVTACPMDGGGLGITAGGEVVSVWRREQTVFAAEPGGRERKVGEGVNPALANDGRTVAWVSPAGLNLTELGATEPMTLDPKGNFPALGAFGDGSVIVAWERGGRTLVTRLATIKESR
jgi:BNR repeat-like domain